MIDDEDDEEILNKKVSLKSILKNILLIVLIIVGALFIYLGGNQVTNFFIGFTLICLGSSLIQMQSKEEEPTRQTLTILKCQNCDVTKVRNYHDGDFVFRATEPCTSCEGLMDIIQIYSVKLTKKGKKKQEKKKEEAQVLVKSSLNE
jgi:hypothetical protein